MNSDIQETQSATADSLETAKLRNAASVNQQQSTARKSSQANAPKKRQPMGFGKTMLASALGFILAIILMCWQ